VFAVSEFLCGALGDEVAVIEETEAGGEAARAGDVVGDDDERGVLFGVEID
jgi:hypothetical protein